jgi:glycosyltransferase involved in cell wall biosynthesis
LTVLLIANYRLDHQQSMIRVAEELESGLQSIGVSVTVVRPPLFFGRILQTRGNLAKWLGYLDKFLLFPFILIRKTRRFDLVHIVDHSNAMYRFWLGSKKTVVNCNDLLAVRSALGELREHRTGFTGKILQRWILAGLRRVERIACISEATSRDVLRLTKRSEKEVSKIYPGLGKPFRMELEQNLTGPANAERETAGKEVVVRQGLVAVPVPYILHVGGETWYKNRSGVLEIYSLMRERLGASSPALVMVGPLRNSADGVFFLQDLSDQDLVVLYRHAQLLLFPSLYEGFGLPVIEAQACGCPVLTTGRAPLTEIGGDGAVYIENPADAAAAADKAVAILRDDLIGREQSKWRGFYNASRFSEHGMIKSYLRLYEALLAE